MKRTLTVGLVALAQMGFVTAAVAPQLSARLTGESYVLRVAPLDPIDPFRGAYVQLTYPDLERELRRARRQGWRQRGTATGDVYLTLRAEDGTWVAEGHTRTRPETSPYLACDSDGWEISCGIDSWFLPQDEALAMERELADGAYAEVRIDGAGHAVLVDVREQP